VLEPGKVTQLTLACRAPDESASVVVRRNRVVRPQRYFRNVVGQKFGDNLWLQAIFVVAETELTIQVTPPAVDSACLGHGSRVVPGSGDALNVNTMQSKDREGNTGHRGDPLQNLQGMTELS